MKTKQLVLMSILIALSIVLNWMENVFFPWTVLPVPGAKLGLANAVFLILLLVDGWVTALTVSVLRVIILALITGTLVTVMLPLSLGGAVVSVLLMQLVWLVTRKQVSLIGLSMVGAVGHNLGQFAVLSFTNLFPGLSGLFYILPGLLLLSIPAGMITGWIAKQIYPVIKREWEGL
ncbi:MAG TPA: Gx transporter family protein [Bacillota bacterium]|nr:Gx transporter family protein [Bacillota bacterium]HPT87817.1 Gx transporter family protein [Bacillota bacterium]